MNCEEVAALLSAKVDGELDLLRAHAVARHAAGCLVCGQRLQSAQALKDELRKELPYFRASPALQARARSVSATWPSTPSRQASAQALSGRWGWFGGGLLTGSLLAGLLWAVATPLHVHVPREDLSSLVVGLHTRATLSNQLIGVASSDRHTVRPWLSARLDYAVPVADWAKQGYALAGARIDHLEGHPVAALVYRCRDHVIDVFVRPAAPGAGPPPTHTVRGFNVAAAVGAEMQWVAASDLNRLELEKFANGLASNSVSTAVD